MKNLPQIRRRTGKILRKIAARIEPSSSSPGITYGDLGKNELPLNAPRALIFFSVAGVDRYANGQWPHDPVFKKHTIHGDSVAMVQELNRQGYVVDFCDLWKVSGRDVDWGRYSVVIDNWDNLRYRPKLAEQTAIAFCNGWHWIRQNMAELERILWFRERTGITVPSNRQVASNLSDDYADIMTYYGTPYQLEAFSVKPKKHLLNLCALMGEEPEYKPKDIAKAKNKFMWIGGGGMLHKGLDIILEAFQQMPTMELYIAGNPQEEPLFWQWARVIIQKNSNIHLLGWQDTSSPAFNEIADQCIGTVYASASEGGPASVARVLFNGQIPIVTNTSFVRAESFGYTIESCSSAQEMADAIMQNVQTLAGLPESELQERSDAVRVFAKENHTRKAFTESFRNLIAAIKV